MKWKSSWVEKSEVRSITNCCHRQNWLDLGKNHILPVKNKCDSEKWQKTKHLSDAPFLPGSTTLLHSQLLCLLCQSGIGQTGNGCCGQFMTLVLCCSFLLTLLPLIRVRSLPQDTVHHKLLQPTCSSMGSSSWATVAARRLLQVADIKKINFQTMENCL